MLKVTHGTWPKSRGMFAYTAQCCHEGGKVVVSDDLDELLGYVKWRLLGNEPIEEMAIRPIVITLSAFAELNVLPAAESEKEA